MKYYYLFILIVGIAIYSLRSKSELNKEHALQIESLIIHSQDGEKAVTNKAYGLMANSAYYIGKLYDKTAPMVVSQQFVMPVLKYGIPGKEPEYDYHNESPRLGLHPSGYKKAVILNIVT